MPKLVSAIARLSVSAQTMLLKLNCPELNLRYTIAGWVSRLRQLRGGGGNDQDEIMKTPASKKMKTPAPGGAKDQFHHGSASP